MLSRWDVPRKILLFWGIGTGKSYTIYTFSIFVIALMWYITFIVTVGDKNFSYLTIVGFIVTPLLVDAMWLILYSRRMKLEGLFKRIHYSSQSQCASVIQLLCWLILMLNSSTLIIIFCFYEHKCNSFYSLNFTKDDLGSFMFWALVLFSANVTQLVKSNFSCSVAAIYCALCHRCRCKILEVKRELEARDVPLAYVLRRYQETLKTVSLLEDVFSPVLFVLVIVNFLSIFTSLAILLFEEMDAFESLDVAIIFTLNLSSLVAYSAFGAEITVCTREVNLKLYEINEKMSFCPNWANEKSFVEAMLLRPEIVLSACNVLYFNRGFILAMLGSLLTYGLVLVQFSKCAE